MDTIARELVLGLRRLAKAPALTAIVVIVLGLGVAASTAIFSVVDGVLLAELPYGDADELVMLIRESPRYTGSAFAPAELADFRRIPSLESVSGAGEMAVNLTGDGEPLRLRGASVSANLFETLGVPPLMGSGFSEAAEEEGGPKEVVISHGLWQSRFGGAGDVLGKSLELNDESHQVVAVMPPGFSFPAVAELWTPGYKGIPRPPQALPGPLESFRSIRYYSMIGRIADGASPARVESDLLALHASLEEDFPREYEESRFLGRPLKEHVVGDSRRQLLILQGAVLLVLLVACANVANLLIVRSLAQRKDRAIRRALGAGRGRLWAFALGESLLLGLGGGLLGTALAFGAVRLLKAFAPLDLPRLEEVAVNGRVLLFCLAVSLLSGLLAGLIPAFDSARGNLVEGLRRSAGDDDGTGKRLRAGLVALEVALALLLLIGAGLMMRSLFALRTADPGFEAQGVAMVRFDLPAARYPTDELRASFYRSAYEEISSLPGVEDFGIALGIPFSGAQIGLSFEAEGQAADEGAGRDDRVASFVAASPGYFEALGIPLLAGRAFEPRDTSSGEQVMLVSRALAERTWPGEDPIGKRISVGDPERDGWSTVVGVVGDVRQGQLDADPAPTMYGLYTDQPWPFMSAVVKSSLEPQALHGALKTTIQGLDPRMPVQPLRWVEESIAETLAERRFLFALLGVFAGLALTLAGIGLYGLVSYSVARRRREIGIRMALGARREKVVALVVRQGLALAASGVAAGLVSALWLTNVLAGFLFEVEPRDPLTFAVFTLVLTAVAAIASYVPARRAARVDPNLALRVE